MDSPEVLEEKCSELAQMLLRSKCVFVVTGAGISTSAGIADFRGPKGVWTIEKEGRVAESVDFSRARPTLTHRALRLLEERGLVKFVVSQNVDGLHPKSSFPLNRLAELHGNVFCEQCERCSRRYYREFATGTVGLKLTGRFCEGTPKGRACRGRLRDTTLDWEDALPEPDLTTAYSFAKVIPVFTNRLRTREISGFQNADLSLCLGTSLQIVPVSDMPLLAKKNGGKMVTVNLQATKHEKKTDLAIHGFVDDVMVRVLKHLDIPLDDGKEETGGEEAVRHGYRLVHHLCQIRCLVPEIVWKSTYPLEEFKTPKNQRKRSAAKIKKQEPVEEKCAKFEGNCGGVANDDQTQPRRPSAKEDDNTKTEGEDEASKSEAVNCEAISEECTTEIEPQSKDIAKEEANGIQ
ncbi:transcriptional regulator, Sir2 family [Ancylostoma duodenale]|uniref:protein acetyllysine N-acetyltransferase n=1 Tax=Ancylostoma duodenale TaxID=51022 RepID=A0A0C2H4W8_9BILA|nr:transcriptional regulator, Sir2 family [Ancylostoma duodenale]